MLIEFSVKNFRSIKDETSIDMTFSQNDPGVRGEENTLYLTPAYLKYSKRFTKIIPLLVILGGNATGKSNLLSAINNIKSIVSKDVNFVEKPFPFEPFLLSNTENDPTVYSIKIMKNGRIYKYVIALGKDKIYSEELLEIVYEKNTKTIVEKTIFNVNRSIYNIEVKKGNELDFGRIYETECNSKSLFLSKIAIKYSGVSAQINDVFDYIKNDIEYHDGNDINTIRNRSLILDKASQSSDSYSTMRKISRLLSRMDIDLEEVIFNRTMVEKKAGEDLDPSEYDKTSSVSFRRDPDGKILFRVDNFKSIHKKEDGSLIQFDFEKQESLGTRTLFSLLGIVINVIENGKTFVIDEIDRNIHTDLLILILKMFTSKSINKKGAQLICTSHNPCILLSLKKSEVAFTDKEKGATKVTYLSEIDIKNENNFLKNYLSGRFGGKPLTINDIDLEDL